MKYSNQKLGDLILGLTICNVIGFILINIIL